MKTASLREVIAFATAAHAGQFRKYTGAPYIRHPLMVSRLVSRFKHDQDMLFAAILHDTAEDTAFTIANIDAAFGSSVARLVDDLTDVSSESPREVRFQKNLEHTSRIDPRAKTIKLMDIVHNISSVVRYDKKFAQVYLPEKMRQIEVLVDASDRRAWMFAAEIHNRACERLDASLMAAQTEEFS